MRLLAGALCVLLPVLALAQLAPHLQRGLDWLSSRVQPTLVVGEQASAAMPLQVRAETAQTLRALAALPASLTDVVFGSAVEDADTETLSRQVAAGASSGRDLGKLLAELARRQNADGGFGGGAGYTSHGLDTAWAVLALSQAGQAAGASALRARAWLAGEVASDGPMAGALAGAAGARSPAPALQLYLSALTSLALQTGSDDPSVYAVQRLTTWLASRQGADGGWAGDTLVSAWVLLALVPTSGDEELKAAAGRFLQARQAADGSWGGDPYLTAVALRALTARPDALGSGTSLISGLVQDGNTGLPLEGASIVVGGSGEAPRSSASDSQGRFSLGGVPAGSWTVLISRPGYVGQAAAVALPAGQAANLGIVRLQPSSTTGLVRGVVTQQATGQPLAGAAITVTVAGQTQTQLSDGVGRFEFSAVSPGTVALGVTLANHLGASATATLAAGQTLVFSPALVANGGATGGPATFFGQVVDAPSRAPLAGVTVEVRDAATGALVGLVTGSDGRFTTPLPAGSYVVRYSAPGYNGAEQRVVLTSGSAVNAGVLPLSPQATDAQLRGVVRGDDGRPLAGATVTIGGLSRATQSAPTAVDGSYVVSGISLGAAQLPGLFARLPQP